MGRIRRMIIALVLGMAALAAAAGATLGTIWCAQKREPGRTLLFAGMMAVVLAIHMVLRQGNLAGLMMVEGAYLMLFLFVRRFHSIC